MTTTTHCKDTGPSEPASCLLSILTTMEPGPRLQQRSCTHLWSTWQGSITTSIPTACATRQTQDSSAPGTVWQGEKGQRQGPKPNQEDSWQRGHSETEAFESCMCWKHR